MYVKGAFTFSSWVLAICLVHATAVTLNATTISTAALATETSSISWPLIVKNITKYTHYHGSNETNVTYFGDRTIAEPPSAVTKHVANLQPEASDVATVLSSFTTASFGLAGVTCAVAAVASAGAACIFGCVAAAIAVIMNVLYVSTALGFKIWGTGSGSTKRSDLLIDWEFEPQFQASEDCHVGCQLRNNVKHSTWTHFGNMTVDGAKHKLHFWQNGSLSGLKVQQLGTKKNYKRDNDTVYIVTDFQQEDDLIMTFYYVEDSVQGIDDWGSDDTTTAANDAANYIVENNVNMGCFDIGDSDGTIMQSVFMLDDSDLVENLPSDDISPVLRECYLEDPYTTSPLRKLK